MRILIVSLESANLALTNELSKFLKSNEDNEIKVINLLDYRQEDGSYLIPGEIRENFKDFNPDKMIFSAHGLATDSKYCYYRDKNHAQCHRAANSEQVAEMLSELLPEKSDRVIPIDLIVCYGARTPTDCDHVEESKNVNWFDSFSYRTYMNLENRSIRTVMSAYLTSVEIQEGVVLCENEESIEIRAQIKEITDEANAKYKALEEKQTQFYESQPNQDKLIELEDLPTEIQNLYSEHLNLIMEIDSLKDKLNCGLGEKQGEIKYEITNDNLTIEMTDKHKELYSGYVVKSEEEIQDYEPPQDKPFCKIM